MNIPLLDLKTQYATIRDEVSAAIDRVVESQQFILGPEVEAFEREIAAYCACQYGVGVSSGTDALLVALMAVDIKGGDEVITTPYSFFATAGAIARLGAKPVFVDIDPLTYNIDPSNIESAITERTRAIMPVHLFGQMADMGDILSLAKRYKLYVIEDAAQAIGAERDGRRAGSMGHIGCFSFYPSKNLGGFGDGGMVTTNDPELADRVRLLRNHGHMPKYHSKVVGGNFRLDAIQAAVLRVKLQCLDGWTKKRQRNAQIYHRYLTDTGHAIPSESVPCLQGGCRSDKCWLESNRGIVLPTEATESRHVYNQFVIRTSQRDVLMAHLKKVGVGTEIYYPLPLHLQECFNGLGYQEGDFPASECAAKRTLALPIYPELTDEMIASVVEAIDQFFR